jgi:plastocyanin
MTRPPVSEGTAAVIKLGDCAFYPTVTHVPVGSEVQFFNADLVGHEVVGANLTWGHHDKILEPGDQLGVTFAKAGLYPYACMLHPGMTGVIVVGDAASAAGAAGGTVPGGPSAEPRAAAPVDPAAASAAAASFDPRPAALGAAILALVAILAASIGMRRRRSNAARPTA